MRRDWSRAEEVKGEGRFEPHIQLGKNVKPPYTWWNGTGAIALLNQPVKPGPNGKVSMYRPQREPWDALMKAGRCRFGAVLVPSDRSGMRRLLEALRAGNAIGVLPDQDPPRGSGVFAPFFGITAHTPVFASCLARRTGATILYVYAERLSWGRGYVLHIDPAPPEVTDEDEVRAATAMNRALEACIRRFLCFLPSFSGTPLCATMWNIGRITRPAIWLCFGLRMISRRKPVFLALRTGPVGKPSARKLFRATWPATIAATRSRM